MRTSSDRTVGVEAARARARRFAVLTLLAVPAWGGCQDGTAAAGPPSMTADELNTEHAIPEVLATIGGESITMEDVRVRVGETLAQIETRYLMDRSAAIETALDAILRDRVLLGEARERGTTVEMMLQQEAGGSLAPSDDEVASWYMQNLARLGNRPLDQVRPQIVEYLESEKRQEAIASLQARLNEEKGVEVFLEKFRLTFNDAGAPDFGPRDAKVTLVEFSDFECPFCARFFPVLQQVKAEYGDRIRIVYRQFPLTNLHPNAFKAAEASMCAHAQGRFWEMHDLMFQEQTRLTVRDLKEKAGRLGLDQEEFDECLDTGRYVGFVQDDFAEGRRVGANGTPTMYLNGVQIEGGANLTFDMMSDLIEAELAAAER